MSARRQPLLIATLLAAGLALLLHGGWIQAKAVVAQGLLDLAWQRSRADGQAHRAWPWADHRPVARLSVPSLGIRQIVLDGDAGAALAFAPGHSPASGLPGERRTVVISGHRDTHFRFLRDLPVGAELQLTGRDGGMARWRVRERRIADAREEHITLREDGALLLVTCWPFDDTAVGGPLRLVVRAEPIGVMPIAS